MPMSEWPSGWSALRLACEHRKATGRWDKGRKLPPTFEIAPPATEQEVLAVEARIGRSIPVSFRHVLLSYSAHVRIEWQLRDTSPLPEVFRQIFAGECRWDLSELPALEDTYKAWLRAFPLTDDKYDGPWHNKFPVLEVGNGDMLAIDLSVTDPQPVVYLSHEGDDSLHGFWLGRDYEDYIDRLIQLGCVGSEDWQLLPFVSGPRSSLLPDGENGQQWRKWFGLAFPENDAQSSEC